MSSFPVGILTVTSLAGNFRDYYSAQTAKEYCTCHEDFKIASGEDLVLFSTQKNSKCLR